jgi:hypothetical protein
MLVFSLPLVREHGTTPVPDQVKRYRAVTGVSSSVAGPEDDQTGMGTSD